MCADGVNWRMLAEPLFGEIDPAQCTVSERMGCASVVAVDNR